MAALPEHQIDDLAPLTTPQPQWFVDAFRVPRREGWVESDGCRIHYFAWGDPSLPGVVLTHGMMAHARCWAFIAPLMAERFHLVAVDLSGMGDSGERDTYPMEIRANELLAVAQAEQMFSDGRRPALVCHSFGGSVGITAAQREPDAWSALVICDSTMLLPEMADDFLQRLPKRPDKPRPPRLYADLESAMSRFRLAPEQPCANAYLMEYMAYHSLRQEPAQSGSSNGWRWKFSPSILVAQPSRDLAWWLGLAPKFAALKLPKAYVYGALSEAFKPELGAYFTAHNAASRPIPQIPIPHAYHHIMLDQPLALTAALDSLLQSIRLN